MVVITSTLFNIDYGRLLETFVCIVVSSFFLAKVSAVVFELRLFTDWFEGQSARKLIRKDVSGETIEVEILTKPQKK